MRLLGGSLAIERTLPAPRPLVFASFVDADELSAWWGPQGFTIPSVDLDLRRGGAYRIEMQPPEGDPFHLLGVFREIDPPARLSFTFVWEPPDPADVETVAEVSFRDLGEATEVLVRQGRFATDARRDLHHRGWNESLDKLERKLLPGSRSSSTDTR